MRIVVVGATGNVGTAVTDALAREHEVDSIGGVARRRPTLDLPGVEWRQADVARDDLSALFAGAHAVVHLAWLIQPSRDEATTHTVNVEGSRRVFDAVVEAAVPSLVYASSVGAYSEGPKDLGVDESWPTDGIPSSFYSRHKAEVERRLDDFQTEHPDVRVVRMRPALIFGRKAATGIRRLFLGPLFPGSLLRRSWIPFVPDLDRLVFQAVHRDDVAEAYRLAIHSDAPGPFNVAADPVIDPDRLADLLGARKVSVSAGLLRSAAAFSWRTRLQPTPPGWLDLALGVPVMDSGRARSELDWKPRWTATDALADLIEGLRAGDGLPTPPLDPQTSGHLRLGEFRTGIGARG
jgi:UDP-glucose 4-epimerase